MRSSTPSSSVICPARSRGAWRKAARLIALDAIKLVESGLGALCDVTVAVTAPEEVRVRRIMTRDGISEDYARARVRAQRSEEAFRADCDAVFENNYPTPAQAAFAAEEFLDTIIKNPRRNEPWQRRKRTSGRSSRLCAQERL